MSAILKHKTKVNLDLKFLFPYCLTENFIHLEMKKMMSFSFCSKFEREQTN